MKYLGIDYGTRRIGLALSDDLGTIAFPKEILQNNESYYDYLLSCIKKERVKGVVIGESVQLDGSHNSLQKHIIVLQRRLITDTGLPVLLEKEWLSSVAADSHLYSKGNIANERWTGGQNKERRTSSDDKAAAVILQRYLDKK